MEETNVEVMVSLYTSIHIFRPKALTISTMKGKSKGLNVKTLRKQDASNQLPHPYLNFINKIPIPFSYFHIHSTLSQLHYTQDFTTHTPITAITRDSCPPPRKNKNDPI
ncbi:hypothetical protein NE237_023158 [Protea cynaroides]|uniref:Uncharacterized protein n=1 Tax=Protea cynaroides TaxID=273540 RepID=A0A9Q0HGL1_9MAGN|nr:hypothetical protein NE237_023158 [Protea cynaroides]